MQDELPSSGDSRTFSIIGAAMEVHRTLGCGFLEAFYRDALAIEFGLRSIPFDSEVACGVDYKGHHLRGHYRIDFVCYQAVIVEVKARAITGPGEEAQVLNYQATTGHQVALLLNFGGSTLDYRRFVLSQTRVHKP